MRRIVVMIVGDDAFARSGIRQTLSQQNALEVLDIVESDPGVEGNVAMARILDSSPDIVVLDLGHFSSSGLELSRKITRNFPGTKVVVLSGKPMHDDEELFEVIKSGAVAYLRSKQCTPAELVETIKRAANGEYPINDSVMSSPGLSWRVLREFQEFASIGKHVGDITAPLTSREVQVLTLISEGNSNKQIAGILGTSEQTIKNHVSAVLRKLNANDRAHAVYIAARDGLISIHSDLDTGQRDNGWVQKPPYQRDRGRAVPLTKHMLRSRSRTGMFTDTE